MADSKPAQAHGGGGLLHRAGKRLMEFATAAKYLILLLSLEMLTWNTTFYGDGPVQRTVDIDWEDLNVLITLLAGVFAISRRKSVLVIASLLGVVTMAAAWSSELLNTQWLCITSDLTMALFFGFTALMILHDVWHTEGVTADTVIGSICAYLLIGSVFGFLYSMTELAVPGSFHFSVSIGGDAVRQAVMRHRDYPTLMYYSFVTLTSTGYGDIVPVTHTARMIAWSEAVFGQFYMAVLVARLVAMHLEHSRQKRAAGQQSST